MVPFRWGETTMNSIQERVAIIFMTIAAIATLILGGAVVHELSKTSTATQVATNAGSQGSTASDSGSTGIAAAGGNGTAASAGTSGQVVGGTGATSGQAGGGRGGQAATKSGQLSTAEIGVSNGTITVGGVYDETGPFDATVERDTVRAYFDKVNAAGGANGYRFQLLDCNSAYDPTEAHHCVQKLLDQKVLAMVGWLSVSGEQTETTFLNQQGVPIIGGLGVPTEYQVPLSWPTSTNFTLYGTAMGAHAPDLGIKSPAVVLVNIPFIAPVKDALLASLHSHGITEKYVDIVEPTKPDYTDEVIKYSTSGADSVIAGLDPFSYARFFKAFQSQNTHPKFLGLGLDKSGVNQTYGPEAEGAESLTPFLEPADHLGDPAIADYMGTVRTYFPNQVQNLDVYTEGEWTAAEVFVQAIRNIGNGRVTRESLANALNAIKNFDTKGLSVPLAYQPGNSHDPNHCFQWIRKVNGTWTTHSGWNCF
jgi:branched-chain amino acid transport system substrate-binding protein